MEWYEIRTALKYQHYAFSDTWESARMVAFYEAQTHSRQSLELKSIYPFYWEEDSEEKEDTSITKADIERLKKKAENYINYKNNKKN